MHSCNAYKRTVLFAERRNDPCVEYNATCCILDETAKKNWLNILLLWLRCLLSSVAHNSISHLSTISVVLMFAHGFSMNMNCKASNRRSNMVFGFKTALTVFSL